MDESLRKFYASHMTRFLCIVVWFVGLVAIQLLALHFANGFQRIYAPFVGLVEPFVRRHYGGSDGSLGPLLFWGLILGIFIYSSVLALVGAFLISRGFTKSSSD